MQGKKSNSWTQSVTFSNLVANDRIKLMMMSSKNNRKNLVFSFAWLNVSYGDVNYIHTINFQNVTYWCEV